MGLTRIYRQAYRIYMTTTQTAKHSISYWVYASDGLGHTELLRHSNGMVGFTGWEATCSCGWKTRTGGAIQSYIKREVMWHKMEEGV